MIRLAKCFEGQGPFLVLQIAWREGARHRRGQLIIDANQRTAGVRVAEDKPEDLKPQGTLVNLLRKHAPSGGIAGLWRDTVTDDVWLPIYVTPSAVTAPPHFYLQLRMGSPPEIRFVDKDGTALARKSSQGSFTKRRALEEPLPTWPMDKARFTETFATLRPHEVDPAPEIATVAKDAESTDAVAMLLPDFQRTARDRLTRRLKTVRKTLARMAAETPSDATIVAAEQAAALLKGHLYRVRPGDHELVVEDVSISLEPEATPGHNLDRLYSRVKKLRRAREIGLARSALAERDATSMDEALVRLRGTPLSFHDVEAILTRFKLSVEKPPAPNAVGAPPRAAPYRAFRLNLGDAGTFELLVGKSARDNDELVKGAQGHDVWLHAAGVTGSHVVIPARQLKGIEPPAALVRAGAILALHHSRVKGDRAGEVYLTRRRYLRKKKGMPPGLWQIDKAETLFVRYEEADLAPLLAAQNP